MCPLLNISVGALHLLEIKASGELQQTRGRVEGNVREIVDDQIAQRLVLDLNWFVGAAFDDAGLGIFEKKEVLDVTDGAGLGVFGLAQQQSGKDVVIFDPFFRLLC